MAAATYTLTIDDSLAALGHDITAAIRRCVRITRQRLNLGRVSIEVKPAARRLRQLAGITGYCPRGNYLQISIDRASLGSPQRFRSNLQRSLLHELHHAARAQKGFPLSDTTVFQQVITEGLADYFAFEVTGQTTIWTRQRTMTGKMLPAFRRLYRARVTARLYQDLFTDGSKQRNIKRWAGYALGFSLIKEYVRRHPKETSSTMVGLPPTAFLQ